MSDGSRPRLTSLLFASALSLGGCVALLDDPPDSGAGLPDGSGGKTASGGLGGNDGSGLRGSGGVAGAAGARTGGGGVTGLGGTTVSTGGRTGAGGASGGGAGGSGPGGSGVGGRGVGGSGMGGAVATACTNVGPSANGNGEFTFYYFGQGTSRAQEGGGFRTACGYFGTEGNTTVAGANTSDMVQNIVNPQYFAAIPGTDPTHFNTNAQCGACAQVSYNGRSLIVTIIDECPQNFNQVCQRNPTGELDLSVPAAIALGFGPGSGQNGNPTGQSWRIVPCPVTGNVKVRVKTGNPNEVFIENTILAIKSVTVNGAQATHSFYGTWQLPVSAAAGQTLTLTDAGNRTLTVMVGGAGPNVNQDTGRQFPSCQ
ncbi:MAG TPA: RlpA-like double-psi beta-barrel domain-containing protein [Polyangia bacterium]|jgi:hypothetical protein|nr:RlpA-like double-psi beta-barrel domain-containing protein [Polyangia bacterium]